MYQLARGEETDYRRSQHCTGLKGEYKDNPATTPRLAKLDTITRCLEEWKTVEG